MHSEIRYVEESTGSNIATQKSLYHNERSWQLPIIFEISTCFWSHMEGINIGKEYYDYESNDKDEREGKN